MSKGKTIYRGSRCPKCYWALYDGDWCQNRDCEDHGQSIENKIEMTNEEAYAAIAKAKEGKG